MIVGLAGYARSGKDEAAKGLVNNLGFERRAFADILRKFAYRMNPIVGVSHYGQEVFLVDVINRFTWDGYKETEWGEEIRRLLQRIGTECGRQLISDTIWIDATLGPDKIIDEPKIVVPDVRFPNEFNEIQNRGGMLIRIERPGIEAANDHVSEHALAAYWPYYDTIIVNDGSINQLHDKVRRAVSLYFG